MKEPEMRQIARWIAEVLNNIEDEATIKRVRSQVELLTEKFPLYERRRVAVGTPSCDWRSFFFRPFLPQYA